MEGGREGDHKGIGVRGSKCSNSQCGVQWNQYTYVND